MIRLARMVGLFVVTIYSSTGGITFEMFRDVSDRYIAFGLQENMQMIRHQHISPQRIKVGVFLKQRSLNNRGYVGL